MDSALKDASTISEPAAKTGKTKPVRVFSPSKQSKRENVDVHCDFPKKIPIPDEGSLHKAPPLDPDKTTTSALQEADPKYQLDEHNILNTCITKDAFELDGKIGGANFLIIGPTKQGKTALLKLLILHLTLNEFIDRVILFSHSAEFETEEYSWIDRKYIFPFYKPEILAKLVKHNEDLLKEGKPCFRWAVVFDDCPLEQEEPFLQTLATSARHKGISLIFSLQYYTMVRPWIRENTHFLLLRKVIGLRSFKGLADLLVPVFFESSQEMREWTKQLVQYSSLLVDMLSERNSADDYQQENYLIRFDAAKVPKFQVL